MARSRRNDFLIPTLGVCFDACAIEFAFLVSYYVRFKTPLLAFLPLREDVPPLNVYIYGSLFIIAVWLVVFKSRGMYGSRRNADPGDELASVVKLVTFGMLLVVSAAFFYRAFSYSRVVVGLLWGSSIISVFTARMLLFGVERMLYRSGRELRNAVIVGTNETAGQIFQRYHRHPLLGYRLVGYFGDAAVTGGPLLSAEYLGAVSTVPETLVGRDIELAFIALDRGQYPQIYSLMQECEGITCEFLLVPDILHLLTGGLWVKEIEGMPFIRMKGTPMSTWGRILKRSFDLSVASLLLVVSSPLFAIVALVIKLDSRGPVFYRQERVGIDGEKFFMIKFRSMNMSAEAETGPVWAKDHDPRRTKSGSFLRKSSIDELPQLINVVKGEMSLVGPRPERPYFVEQFKHNVSKYRDRHRMKTGMTGWAQVNGLRGNTSLQERINYDVYYIENWSLGFDLRILLRTIRALVSTKNVH
jgi:exopolysaccharide biosynthesis polyprenyl glycosylphosphotransferase